MTQPEDYQADESVIDERRPTNCPFCGYSGAFDGQGTRPESIKVNRASVSAEFEATWYQSRCPDCNGRFRMLEEVEERCDK